MRRIAYRLRAATDMGTGANTETIARGETIALARPSRAAHGFRPRIRQLFIRHNILRRAAVALIFAITIRSSAETRPHYGGILRITLQSAPNTLEIPANATPADYWDAARVLSLIGNTLVSLDAQARPQAALAVAWQSDATERHWQFTLRHGVKFHDGSAASPAAIAQILGALHPTWVIRPSADSISIFIDSDAPMPSLLAELALPRNILLKRNVNGIPVGTGPFVIAEWQPGKLLKLAANEDSWAGRPFVDEVEIEFGRSLRDQAIALQLEKADIIETPTQSANASQRQGASSTTSLPVELLALVFPANSKAQDPRLREALALAIDRKPIQSVLLKGAGEPAASILPNWMTGYSAAFSTQSNPQRARTVLADSRQPTLNLSYDPRDPQAQLIAERIALNAKEVGIAIQVSLSGAEDIRLLRVAVPSPDPAMALSDVARQLGMSTPLAPPRSLDDLYQAEHALLDGYRVIPLFHLPLGTAISARVHGWEPDLLGLWSDPASPADFWLDNAGLANIWPSDSRPQIGPR
jgi:ABC-type transport system substrate-binding protein